LIFADPLRLWSWAFIYLRQRMPYPHLTTYQANSYPTTQRTYGSRVPP